MLGCFLPFCGAYTPDIELKCFKEELLQIYMIYGSILFLASLTIGISRIYSNTIRLWLYSKSLAQATSLNDLCLARRPCTQRAT